MKKNYPDSFITREKEIKPDSQMTLLSRFPRTMTKVLSLFFLLFFTTLTTSGSDQHAIVGWNYGNGKVMYCGMGYMMSTTSGYWGNFFQHNAQKTLFVNMVKMNSYVTNPVVGIFYSPGSTGYPNSITADTLIAILGRAGITGVKVTSDMIDTQAEINNYNVLIMGGSGQWGGEQSAGYVTVQSVVKSFVQNDHGGVIFTGWSVFTLLGLGASEYNDMIPVELSPDYGYQHTYTLVKHLPGDPLFNGVGTIASTGYCEFPQGNIKAGAIAYGGLAPYVPYVLPTVTTAAITTFNANTATMGGNVTAEGTAPVTSRGVVYSSTDNTPELGESGVLADANGSGPGSFSETVGGLAAGTTYYVRAYATSTAGTSYGGTVNFITQAAPVAPIITHFSPVTGTIGTSVTIYGSGFSTTPANNTVWFGAVKATVGASTATSITITVPARAGSVVPVSVIVNGLIGYSATCTTPTFTLTNTPNIVPNYLETGFTAGTGTQALTCGDFNGDGIADMATANIYSDNISVLLGSSDGSFGTTTNYTAGDGPSSIVSGDFNGDGHLDLAVANFNSGNVSILLGNGTGSFGTASNIMVGNYLSSIVSGDFNSDGKTDLATCKWIYNNVSVLLGNGNGGFGSAVNYAVGYEPRSIAIGDFNADGKADLAIANTQSSNVSILYGTGSGTFGTATNLATGAYPLSVASGDFNNDGKTDLTAVYEEGINIFINTGNSGLVAGDVIINNHYPLSVAVGDFNGDGNTDLITNSNTGYGLTIVMGTGTGSFGTPASVSTNIYLAQMLAGDFNGDGKADIAGAGKNVNELVVLLNTPSTISPTVTTAAITAFTTNTATMGGNVTAEGSASVTSRGVVYSATDNTPELGESGVLADANGSGPGSFSESIGGLTAGLTYYVRAYATSSAGTGYGTTLSFTTISCVNPTSGGSISEDQIICYGNIPTTLSSVQAPSGHTGTLEYKWQLSTTSASAGFNDIVNSNSATWSPGALTTTTWFRRLARVECITNDWASAAVSNTVTITVLPEFTAGAIETTGETICFNSDPGEIPNATAASGGDGTISYQWQSSTVSELTGFNNISGANDVTYNPPSGLTESTWYRRTAKDGSCSSSPAKQPLKLNSQIHSPLAYNKNELQTIPQNSFSIANGKAGGASPNQNRSLALRYDDGVNFSGIGFGGGGTFQVSAYWPAATMAQYTGMALSQVEIYIHSLPSSCMIKIYGQGTANTPGGLLHEQAVTITPTSWNLISLTSEVEITGEDLWIGYEISHGPGMWPAGCDDGPAITGFSDMLSMAGVWYSMAYFGFDLNWNIAATLIDGGEYTISAGVWKVDVLEDFTPGAIETTGENICYNGDPAQIGSATPASGGDQVISYQWQSSTTGESTDFSDIIGADEASYNPPSGITETTWFLRMAKDGTCQTSFTASAGLWKVTVEPTPVAGTLTKTPNVMNVCENDIVSAILTSGNGGNGIDELEFRTNNGTWSAWAAYVSGTDISTADLSGVEIRTRRTATYCESTAYTSVSWSVEATPIAGMLVKTPDVDGVCIGDLVSATLIAGTGGNGMDFLEYRTHDGSAWTDWSAYISGTSINTTPFTSVEIRTWRTATYCENSDFNVVSWDVNPYTVGGVVEGPEGVCYGINSTILLATGYTGSIVMWQTSTDYWATITNIQHTEPTLLVENLIVTTQFRTVVQSGSCGQVYSIAAEIGVDPIPAPFIAGAEVICDLNEIYEYVTEPDMVNYQWSVSSGQIISGQGSNLVTVQWSGSGEQSITVDYQTVFGCTMPEPFSIAVEILTPETPVITIEGFTLTSSATDGNQWYMNGIIIEGATSQTYEVTENGDYTCVVTL
ncbi:MAG: FG-GAP repeat-containing, partial [Bacteroidetes bacterium]